LLACGCLLAQQPDNLLERIRNCHLPEDQRAELVESFSSKDYGRTESLLDQQSAAAGQSALAAELAAVAGAVEFLDGHMQRAAEAFRHSDSLVALGDRDRFTWAMALVKLDDAQGAREQLTRLSTAHPDTSLYLYWLSRIDYDQRLYTEAVEKLRRVIRLDPESARAYDNLGLALDMLGQSEEAERAFRKAVEFNRKLSQPSAWPPHNLGAQLLRTQKLGEAETALRESLRYDPQFSMAHYHLGRVLDALGRDNDAIEEYRAASTLAPVVVEALYSLGLVYRRHDRTAEADAAFAEYKRLRAAGGSDQNH
jgi:tetratricopeptide (TPR) repeat protein